MLVRLIIIVLALIKGGDSSTSEGKVQKCIYINRSISHRRGDMLLIYITTILDIPCFVCYIIC